MAATPWLDFKGRGSPLLSMNIMVGTVNVLDAIPPIAGLVAMGVLFLMMLLTLADVVLRATFNKPIIGAAETAEQMMVAIVFLGLRWCALQGKKIRVDLFASRYSPAMQRVVDLMVCLVGLIMVAIVCWRTFLATLTVEKVGIAVRAHYG